MSNLPPEREEVLDIILNALQESWELDKVIRQVQQDYPHFGSEQVSDGVARIVWGMNPKQLQQFREVAVSREHESDADNADKAFTIVEIYREIVLRAFWIPSNQPF